MSSIFNVFWILGVSALVRSLPFAPNLNTDILVAALATGAVFLALFVGKRHQLERWQGVIGVAGYVTYLGFLIWRG
jgi:cation:H+ antiporter